MTAVSFPRDRLGSLTALVITLALVAGCQAAPATSTPTSADSTTPSASTPPSPTSSGPSPTATPAPTPAPSVVAAHWEPAGTMSAGRIGPHAVLLGDGRVLVMGGDTPGEEGTEGSARVESWDPATGAWRTTESLNNPRTQFAALSLADGRVLVTGGLNDSEQSFSSTYVYDPRPGYETWSKVGLLGTARTAPAAALLPDGRVLVAGGYYHTGPIEGGAAAPDAILASDRRAAPGTGESRRVPLDDVDVPPFGYALATAELFDPATGSWSGTGAMNFARVGAAAVTLSDGRVLVVGSSPLPVTKVDSRAYFSAEIYDPATGRFSLAGQLPEIDRSALESLGVPLPDGDPQPAANGTLAALKDGGAVLIAHASWWKHQGDIVRSFRFDAGTGQWLEIGQPCAETEDHDTGTISRTPGVCRVYPFVAALDDGRVLVAGGQGAYQSSTPSAASADLYDPATNTWSSLPPMPAGRAAGPAAVLTDGTVLLVGGYDERLTQDGYELVVLPSAIRFVPAH